MLVEHPAAEPQPFEHLRVTEQIVSLLVEHELEEIALRLWRVGRG
jgi:hypothetical protein